METAYQITSKTPLLSYGSYGADVARLQKMLSELGYYPWAVDLSFGSGTYGAVTAFQMESGLFCDGIVGGKTWDALLARHIHNNNNHDRNGSEEHENMPVVFREHIVVPGDSLYHIAEKYGAKIDAIMKANDLHSTVISVGRVIIIP